MLLILIIRLNREVNIIVKIQRNWKRFLYKTVIKVIQLEKKTNIKHINSATLQIDIFFLAFSMFYSFYVLWFLSSLNWFVRQFPINLYVLVVKMKLKSLIKYSCITFYYFCDKPPYKFCLISINSIAVVHIIKYKALQLAFAFLLPMFFQFVYIFSFPSSKTITVIKLFYIELLIKNTIILFASSGNILWLGKSFKRIF